LLSVVSKVFTAMLNKRLAEFCEEKGLLVEEQGGFRRGRGCTDQLFVLTDLLAGRRQAGKRTYACFIDVRKAYDRVWRDGLMKTLWEKGIRGRAWRVIRSYYEDVKSCVRLQDGDTGWFGIDVGVRQGCVLSPLLFDLFIDAMAREVKALGLGVQGVALLLYADDVVLVAESDLQKMLNAVAAFFKRWRLEANLSKTKVMAYGDCARAVGRCCT
jgi:hypothetical protein